MSYSVFDVFTPTRPAKLTFIERSALNDVLVNAIRTPGKQIVVYGHSGSGKTTLLNNKLEQLYTRHITGRCLSNTTVTELILNAFDDLNIYYSPSSSKTESSGITSTLAADYLGIKATIEANSSAASGTIMQRVIPPQLNASTLARFIGAVGGCWVIEDFHKVANSEKKVLSQMMKIFMDTAVEYPSVKIIALGAVDTARQVVEYDGEMRNRVAEINVPLMQSEELMEILDRSESLLNVSIPHSIKNQIVFYANGLASICHHLGLNLCLARGVQAPLSDGVTFLKEDFETALKTYISEISDSIKATFDKASRRAKDGKFDNCTLIMQALTEFNQDGATHTELIKEIRKIAVDYPAGNLTVYLRKLTEERRGEMLRFDPASGRYSFSDPIYRAVALVRFKREKRLAPFWTSTNIRIGTPEFENTLFNVIISNLWDAYDLASPSGGGKAIGGEFCVKADSRAKPGGRSKG